MMTSNGPFRPRFTVGTPRLESPAGTAVGLPYFPFVCLSWGQRGARCHWGRTRDFSADQAAAATPASACSQPGGRVFAAVRP